VDEVREAMAALELEKRSMILMPINDNDHIDRAGGSHWYRDPHARECRWAVWPLLHSHSLQPFWPAATLLQDAAGVHQARREV
jgi:hypothetical protein